MRKEQYVRFLTSVYRKSDGGLLSPSSVDHYANESIRKIDEFLRESRISEFDSIYDIDSLSELERIRSVLFDDPAFKKLNKDGNQMYSAGFNRYMDFASGRSLDKKGPELFLLDGPIPRKEARAAKGRPIQNRDRIIVQQVVRACGYSCQIDPGHETFIAAGNQRPYVEGHHLIPLKWQYLFDCSLDVYANILALCPNCHRLLHHGDLERSNRTRLLLGIFDERESRFERSGIRIGRDDFMDLALAARGAEE